jgi:hypothetical protein
VLFSAWDTWISGGFDLGIFRGGIPFLIWEFAKGGIFFNLGVSKG